MVFLWVWTSRAERPRKPVCETCNWIHDLKVLEYNRRLMDRRESGRASEVVEKVFTMHQ